MQYFSDLATTLIIGVCFCFLLFTVKSCVIEQETLALERLKIPHKIERTHKATVESSGAPVENSN